MNNWIEKAEQQLEQDYENGDINLTEFNSQSKELYAEVRQEADDCAEQAREDYYN